MRPGEPVVPNRWPTVAAWTLAGLLTITGTLHFLAPDPFRGIVPGFVGSPTFWVAASGVAELACALALAIPTTRAIAGWACLVLFVGVYPANVTMLVHAIDGHGSELIAWLRLPLQLPLIAWAVYIARRTTPARRLTR